MAQPSRTEPVCIWEVHFCSPKYLPLGMSDQVFDHDVACTLSDLATAANIPYTFPTCKSSALPSHSSRCPNCHKRKHLAKAIAQSRSVEPTTYPLTLPSERQNPPSEYHFTTLDMLTARLLELRAECHCLYKADYWRKRAHARIRLQKELALDTFFQLPMFMRGPPSALKSDIVRLSLAERKVDDGVGGDMYARILALETRIMDVVDETRAWVNETKRIAVFHEWERVKKLRIVARDAEVRRTWGRSCGDKAKREGGCDDAVVAKRVFHIHHDVVFEKLDGNVVSPREVLRTMEGLARDAGVCDAVVCPDLPWMTAHLASRETARQSHADSAIPTSGFAMPVDRDGFWLGGHDGVALESPRVVLDQLEVNEGLGEGIQDMMPGGHQSHHIDLEN